MGIVDNIKKRMGAPKTLTMTLIMTMDTTLKASAPMKSRKK